MKVKVKVRYVAIYSNPETKQLQKVAIRYRVTWLC